MMNTKKFETSRYGKAGMLRTLTAAVLMIAMIAGLTVFVSSGEEAAQAAEKTALEEFIAGWGESYAGVMGVKDYTLDFNSFETGEDFSTIDELQEYWTVNNATADHITKIAESDGNKYLKFEPFSQMYLTDGLTDKYVFSFDMKLPANQGFGAFFRSNGETNINPYFEDDQSGYSILGIGPAGIYVIPNEKSVKVYIKFYDEKKTSDQGGKYINNKSFSFKTKNSFTSDFGRISIADYGTGAKIFVEGELVCTLEFSNLVSGYEELLTEYSYYSTVRVFDANGEEKKAVENALVCADTSVLAFGMRINEGYVDNVVISEYPEAVSKIELSGTPKTSYTVGEKFDAAGAALTVTYESGKTKKVALTEDMLEGFDTSAAGEKTVNIKYESFEQSLTVTVSEKAEEPTAAPTAEPVNTDDGKTADKDKDDDSKKGSNTLPVTIAIIAGAVAVCAAVAVAVIIKKKKHE